MAQEKVCLAYSVSLASCQHVDISTKLSDFRVALIRQ